MNQDLDPFYSDRNAIDEIFQVGILHSYYDLQRYDVLF
jgi:hypothetical protein